uniref:Ubiquinone biosynthesis protein coq-8 n=1 Tax=Cucumis melo subsp. melo TaxID=412675 RepID=E5GBW5_CUCME|nr:ubiquinone biosynthesis protein coq-8 [Cucumis melo subsp. melo]
MFPRFDFRDVQEKLSAQFRPWERSFQFWVRVADIYTGYKVLQLRVKFEKDAEKQETMWENQHEHAAEKIYAMCSEMGGFFLKLDFMNEVAQVIGKPDLAPAAWVKRLVTLCDQAPATPFDVVQRVVEKELHRSLGDVFETFDPDPLGSASIAQVHRARLKGDRDDVVVKVQHPGTEDLMMTDIRNLQAFALYMQKTDIKFDLYSVTKEIEKQIGYEFDFEREANAIERIRHFLYSNNKKSPVLVPQVMKNIVTRYMQLMLVLDVANLMGLRVLVMEYIDGIPILNLGDEMAKRGIDASGRLALAAKQKILSSLTMAYGQMILKSGFFHADPHPGNILICKGSEVALLDYGQVKDLPDQLRLGYAKLVMDIADGDASRTAETFRELGIDTISNCENAQEELFKLAQVMFDTRLPPGKVLMQPFAEDSSIKKVGVQSFPEELFSILRTIQILRGLSVGLGINYSCSEQWRPIAEEALLLSGRLEGNPLDLFNLNQ